MCLPYSIYIYIYTSVRLLFQDYGGLDPPSIWSGRCRPEEASGGSMTQIFFGAQAAGSGEKSSSLPTASLKSVG